MMVSMISIVAMCITLLITLVMPLALYVVYGLRKKKDVIWIAGALGAAGFGILQLDIRIPLLNNVSAMPAFMEWVSQNYLMYCFLLAFTAGLFEVVGRYIVAKILCFIKKSREELTYDVGIAAGIGHGGIEAVLLVGMTYINNLLFSIMVNTGTWNATLQEIEVVAEEMGDMSIYQTYAAIPQQLIETPWYLYLAAGYERILTIIAHIAMTLIVVYFVSRKKDIVGIGICLLCHTLLDFIFSVLFSLSSDSFGNMVSENVAYGLGYTFLTLVAIVAGIFIFRMKNSWKSKENENIKSERI